MRIIGGKARGTKLYTLEGNDTRPTLDRVRESLFNIIQSQVPDCIFLDLFSGSGAIGLEAISRGAKKAILCDKSKKAIEIIKKNIEKTHSEGFVELYNMSFEELIKTKLGEKVDIVYIDPPYNSDFAIKSVEHIINQKLIDENLIQIDKDRIMLSKKGIDLANLVWEEFI